MATEYDNLPFDESVEFFRKKLNLPTERWDILRKSMHDKSFTVAGAMKADLLQDLRNATDKAVADGVGLEAFKKDFLELVKKNGWTGWRGEKTEKGRAWRAQIIYDTNISTAYAAGRYAQQKNIARARPFWRYRHSRVAMRPREQHLAWDGLTLRHDDPWWDAHYPPNGWRCFPEGTPVLTPTGWQSIETIRVGDEVISLDGKAHPIAAIYSRPFKGKAIRIVSEQTETTTTPNHRFLTTRGWVHAGDLRVGDEILHVSKAMIHNKVYTVSKVNLVEPVLYNGTVHDVSVFDVHAYVVPIGIAHNCGCYVQTLAPRDMGGRAVDKTPPMRYREHQWPDGTKEKIPEGVDPGFNYTPGRTREDDMKGIVRSKLGWAAKLITDFIAELLVKWWPR